MAFVFASFFVNFFHVNFFIKKLDKKLIFCYNKIVELRFTWQQASGFGVV